MKLKPTFCDCRPQRIHRHRLRCVCGTIGIHASSQFRQAQGLDQRERLIRIQSAEGLIWLCASGFRIKVECATDVVERIGGVLLIPDLPIDEALEFEQDPLDLAIDAQDRAIVVRQRVYFAKSAGSQVSVGILLTAKGLFQRQSSLFLEFFRVPQHYQKRLQIDGSTHTDSSMMLTTPSQAKHCSASPFGEGLL